ncbi:hypothetical protein GCM10010873_03980 [Cypionkella aquatica]|uniref:Argininosuccinate lyase n=1 Tax=Cypionkella aquatica TaxID=1756042 RepID=A0AA37TTI3_9RHOB|nr:hypothetical protein [Cypionkella aquatica]GLS85425.1 hypothetical protein GCM10010873_03980 [Cypionkella aquatica]
MRYLSLLAIALLTACGADGKPTPPQSGISMSGDMRAGVTSGKMP